MNFQEDPSNGAKMQPKSSLLLKKSALNYRPIATELNVVLRECAKAVAYESRGRPL
jgi:hypothetical protein